jgi:hypothetical protein
MTAASYGHLDVVQYLVEELGADMEKANNDGWTALLHAVGFVCHQTVYKCFAPKLLQREYWFETAQLSKTKHWY